MLQEIKTRTHHKNREGCGARLEMGQAFHRSYFPASQAARIRQNVITAERTIGTMKKYNQHKTVTPPKQIASDQVTTGMSLNVSLLSPPSCQAKTAANRRKTLT